MDTKEPKKDMEMSEIEQIKAQLTQVTSERDEYLSGWQRAKADFANYKKQTENSMKEYRVIANESLIEEILPVLQSFEMAFGNKESWEKVDKNWRSGVEYIYTQLKNVVEQHGLTALDPVGKPFDPNFHEALRFESTHDTAQVNTVASVIEKGYTLGGKLIKPAKVVVFELKA